MMLLIIASVAFGGTLHTEIHGDLKSYGVGTIYHENETWETLGLIPSEPTATAIWSQRLRAQARWEHLRLDIHHVTNVSAQQTEVQSQTVQSATSLNETQAVDLSWQGPSGDLNVSGKVDRMVLTADVRGARLLIGRDAVSFGHGSIFTPLDLVNPFTTTQIDQEYKPGVDGARLEYYWGHSNRVVISSVYGGDFNRSGMVYTAYGQGTLGRVDVGGFLGSVREDNVLGATFASYIGPVSVYGDATITQSVEDGWFTRAVIGGAHQVFEGTFVTGELYHQSIGTDEPSEYLMRYGGMRYSTRELWLVGKNYAAVGMSHEVTPLVSSTVAIVGNIGDLSAMISSGVTWSVSNDSTVSLGGYFGAGQRPAVVPVTDLFDPTTGLLLDERDLSGAIGVASEFGMFPNTLYVQMNTYF